MRIRTRALLGVVTATMLVIGGMMLAAPAQAASLQEVTGFGTNPSNLRMFLYVPDRVAPRPAVLVAVHFCTGSGPALFSGTQFASLADQFGFIVIYPSVTRSGGCFDVSTAGALTHNGNSDPVGIVSMVRWVLQNRNVSAAIVGATRPEQIRDNVKASGVILDAAIMKRIDEVLGGVVERDSQKTVSPAKRP